MTRIKEGGRPPTINELFLFCLLHLLISGSKIFTQEYSIIINCSMTFQIKKKNILRITFLKNLTDFRSGIARKVRFCYTGFVAICIWNLTSFEPMALLSPGYQSIIPSSTLSDGTYQQIPLELTQCKSYIGLPFFFFHFCSFFLLSGASLSLGKDYSLVGFRQQPVVLCCEDRNKGEWSQNTGKRQQCFSDCLQVI